jgi:heme A synthase
VETSWRELWTVLHGMGFGTLFMLAVSGAIFEFYRTPATGASAAPSARDASLLRWFLLAMVVVAWLTVFSGAYVVYPWYRARPPVGTFDLSGFPRSALLSDPATSGWQSLGMEWKEHVAWIAPIAISMVAYVYGKYGTSLPRYRGLRRTALVFTLAAFVAAGTAGVIGALMNKHAPVRGGPTLRLMTGS